MSNVHLLSPTPPSSTIEEVDVSISRLCSLLTGAVIEHYVDEDGHIFATDGLDSPVWIDIDEDRKLVYFFTYYSLREHREAALSKEVILDAINTVSVDLILVQLSLKDQRIWGAFWMIYDTRLDPRQFIKMLRRFSAAFTSGIERLQTILES